MNASVVNELNLLLADSLVLNMKLHHFHWRVEGPGFFQLHHKFEELYDYLSDMQDEVAERILMIQGVPLATLKQAMAVSRVEEIEEVPAARDMVQILKGDLETLRVNVQKAIAVAEEAEDRGSANLLDPTLDTLDKELWMLGAFLAG